MHPQLDQPASATDGNRGQVGSSATSDHTADPTGAAGRHEDAAAAAPANSDNGTQRSEAGSSGSQAGQLQSSSSQISQQDQKGHEYVGGPLSENDRGWSDAFNIGNSDFLRYVLSSRPSSDHC